MRKTMYGSMVVLALVITSVYATSDGTITFQGQIVPSTPTTQTTSVQPNNDGTYSVYSTVTGTKLGTFNSVADANNFVSQLNPTIPYSR